MTLGGSILYTYVRMKEEEAANKANAEKQGQASNSTGSSAIGDIANSSINNTKSLGGLNQDMVDRDEQRLGGGLLESGPETHNSETSTSVDFEQGTRTAQITSRTHHG